LIYLNRMMITDLRASNLKVTVWLYLYMGAFLQIFVALYDDDFDTQLCATSKIFSGFHSRAKTVQFLFT